MQILADNGEGGLRHREIIFAKKPDRRFLTEGVSTDYLYPSHYIGGERQCSII